MRHDDDGEPIPAKPRPPEITDLDPREARTMPDLVSLARKLLTRTDRTLGQLEVWARHHGLSLPKSTMSEILSEKRPPKRDHIIGIARGCHLNDSEVRRWDEAWGHIKERDVANKQAQVNNEKNLAESKAQELTERESELGDQVDALKQRLTELISELDRVRNELTSAQQHASTEQARADKLRQDSENLKQQIAELKKQLEAALVEQRRVEQELDSLRQQIDNLESIADLHESYDGLLQLEHSHRFRLEQEVSSLREQVARLLPGEEDDRNDERTPTETAVRRPDFVFHNADAKVELPIQEEEFGRRHIVWIPFKWFCPACQIGGGRDFDNCPRCNERTVRSHRERLVVAVGRYNGGRSGWPGRRHGYGETIRVRECGYRDVLTARPGDVKVKIIRPG